ncbi:MAG: hypothetical protein D6722_01100 [Bacteroidetes bacterium]|nr:MAG: hypothetical protein D6722_01100 [Bacteroidota bacterium]
MPSRLFFSLCLLIASCAPRSLTDERTTPCAYADPLAYQGEAPPWAGIQGALLASRFETLEELQQVVQLEYYPPQGAGIRVPRGDSLVRLTHCSDGRQVVSLLSWGVDESDFLEAYVGGTAEKIAVGLKSPFAVANRPYLQRIFVLSRWRQDFFGEGDPAFFDLASTMVDHINTPEQAFRFPRDSSEKGYLNTFNHVTAQAFITSLYSEELADFVADVHERNTMPELISGQFRPDQLTDPEVNPIDNYVDIVNNEWGQELGLVLRKKYDLHAEKPWTPELLRDYLNDIQAYYAWGLKVGFSPFRTQDTIVQRFTEKLNFVRRYQPG